MVEQSKHCVLRSSVWVVSCSSRRSPLSHQVSRRTCSTRPSVPFTAWTGEAIAALRLIAQWGPFGIEGQNVAPAGHFCRRKSQETTSARVLPESVGAPVTPHDPSRCCGAECRELPRSTEGTDPGTERERRLSVVARPEVPTVRFSDSQNSFSGAFSCIRKNGHCEGNNTVMKSGFCVADVNVTNHRHSHAQTRTSTFALA